uniref:Uncharacterized protein n=1 Tax=Panagrellus redivivus TaxID=6233 RepID=A0A7E4VNG4_PANRE
MLEHSTDLSTCPEAGNARRRGFLDAFEFGIVVTPGVDICVDVSETGLKGDTTGVVELGFGATTTLGFSSEALVVEVEVRFGAVPGADVSLFGRE